MNQKEKIDEKSCGCIIINNGKVLLVKQTKGHWGFPKGHVEANETEEETAIREVKEELGITLDKSKGRLYKTIKRSVYSDFVDVWLFNHNCSIDDIVLQPEETCDAMWASAEKIQQLINKGRFIPLDNLKYAYELLGI